MSVRVYRMKNWYWGRYVTMHEIKIHGWSMSDMEVYIESEHGWHNSEEYKNEKSKST